jgi:hypothetical protein
VRRSDPTLLENTLEKQCRLPSPHGNGAGPWQTIARPSRHRTRFGLRVGCRDEPGLHLHEWRLTSIESSQHCKKNPKPTDQLRVCLHECL